VADRKVFYSQQRRGKNHLKSEELWTISQSNCKIVRLGIDLGMIERQLKDKIIQSSQQYPVVAILGPRQSGKTTLVRQAFPDAQYLNLEEPDTRLFAQKDPRAFLSGLGNQVILDEVQRVPDLLSYLQVKVDQEKTLGRFILTGSQHILLHEKISQTLAGRIVLFYLLPFSLDELSQAHIEILDYQKFLFTGFYPPIYDRGLNPTEWLLNYSQTFIERELRLLTNITNLHSFSVFIRLCAGRIGQLLNLSAIANETGISVNTAKSWLSLLQTSFIVFLLQPHHRNFNKRLVKMPKIYFYDIGLVTALCGISSQSQLTSHYLRGSLFENLIIAELMKWQYNQGRQPGLFFWRDKVGHEVDCIIESAVGLIPVEIKAGATVADDFFKNLHYWQKLDPLNNRSCYLIYGGDQPQKRSIGQVLPWKQITDIFK